MALGGVFAALAVVIMNLGGLIPVATYTTPMLCILLLEFVRRSCGSRTAWAWYGAVAILSLLLSPDKEAAVLFAFLGYYPICKTALDRKKLGPVYKLLIFNASVLAMYWLLMHLFGMDQIAAEFEELGHVLTVVLLILGNVTFFLLDRLLGMRFKRRK